MTEDRFRLGLHEGITDVFSSDPWFRTFAMEIASFYGYPTSFEECHVKEEELMSAYATVNVGFGLKEQVKEWYPWWKEKKPITPELVEQFCRRYYEITGLHIL